MRLKTVPELRQGGKIMCASFGFEFDNDGITSWEDDYFGQKITEDPIEKKDNVV